MTQNPQDEQRPDDTTEIGATQPLDVPEATEPQTAPESEPVAETETAPAAEPEAAAGDTQVLPAPATEEEAPASETPQYETPQYEVPQYEAPQTAQYGTPPYTAPQYGTPSSYQAPAWTPPPAPLVRTTPRTGTIVWGFIILAIGIGALSVAAGATLDVGLAMIWLLAAAGAVLVVASIVGAARRRGRSGSTAGV
ncbi:MAG: hypothetical protein FWF90_06855 [Promicromonosporaceae bacterium]|nr:hypothetical protein [Promicromonosporaceae bacterium]